MRHAIITGGSSGIGLAIARQLAQQGDVNLSIIARSLNKLQAAQEKLQAIFPNPQQQCLTLTADVAQRCEIEQAIASAIEKFSAPDLLITSAGIAHPGYFQELSLEVFEQTMAVNYFGTLYAIRAALPAMQTTGKGNIVMISSGAGLLGLFGYTPYSPSKFALRGLAESLRSELKQVGIQVAIAYPPDTDTPQLAAENLTKPPETKLITETAQMWTAEQVASTILRGVRRQKFVIAPGLEMQLLYRLHSLLAPVLQWYFDRLVARARQN
ncbi:short-chain dehydrogenase [Picosynechococcus sp. PCC 7003]|uniref:SDR family oxidoreductase n=1 Tax=Picosynechococcus sp. PCC 7003 TaxID=374981 RepID=UPI000810C24D|nr:SDR family oxidoreductase [Picosynechococcus sp. PCC 7003]ANV84453.1 short-chain dehydrogenase [Picosynechococcus sp. PCC 7003]